MTMIELLDELERLGVKLETDGYKVKYYPKHLVNRSLLTSICSHKLDIIHHLVRHQDQSATCDFTMSTSVNVNSNTKSPEKNAISVDGTLAKPKVERIDADSTIHPEEPDVERTGAWLEFSTADGITWTRPEFAGMEIVDLVECPSCDGINQWQDGCGGWHCVNCDPPNPRAEKVRQLAAEIRRRWPAKRRAT